jgi:hypothetical protein
MSGGVGGVGNQSDPDPITEFCRTPGAEEIISWKLMPRWLPRFTGQEIGIPQREAGLTGQPTAWSGITGASGSSYIGQIKKKAAA